MCLAPWSFMCLVMYVVGHAPGGACHAPGGAHAPAARHAHAPAARHWSRAYGARHHFLRLTVKICRAGKAGEAGANSFPRHDGQLGRWLSARRSERGHGRAAAESGATDGALRGRGVLHAPHDRRARERDAGSIRRLRAGFVSALRHRRACRLHDSRITRAPHQSNYAAHLWSN